MTNGEAIDLLDNLLGVIEDNHGSDYDEAIHMAIDALKRQQWISVSERLPSYDEYKKNNGLFNVSDGNRSYSEWFDIYNKRRFGEPTMYGFRVDHAVIAWRPLPEPYKGGEDE